MLPSTRVQCTHPQLRIHVAPLYLLLLTRLAGWKEPPCPMQRSPPSLLQLRQRHTPRRSGHVLHCTPSLQGDCRWSPCSSPTTWLLRRSLMKRLRRQSSRVMGCFQSLGAESGGRACARPERGLNDMALFVACCRVNRGGKGRGGCMHLLDTLSPSFSRRALAVGKLPRSVQDHAVLFLGRISGSVASSQY
jgi:hypothetical protein